MKITFEDAVDIVLAKEGGFQDDKEDKGNWTGGDIGKGVLKGTKFGISAAAYPDLDIKSLKRSQAVEIYRRDYWQVLRAEQLPDSLRLTVFDMAVNAGITRAIKLLQSCCKVEEDGILGPITISQAQLVGLEAYTKARKEYYKEITIKDPRKLKYFDGWIKRTLQIEKVTKKLLG